jgi:hypothetical protein
VSFKVIVCAFLLAVFAVYVVPAAVELLTSAHAALRTWRDRRRGYRVLAGPMPPRAAAPEPLPPIDSRDKDVPQRPNLPRRITDRRVTTELLRLDGELAADPDHRFTAICGLFADHDTADH